MNEKYYNLAEEITIFWQSCMNNIQYIKSSFKDLLSKYTKYTCQGLSRPLRRRPYFARLSLTHGRSSSASAILYI